MFSPGDSWTCNFPCSLFCQVALFLFCFLMPSAGTFPCYMPFISLFFSWCGKFPFLYLVQFEWHLAWVSLQTRAWLSVQHILFMHHSCFPPFCHPWPPEISYVWKHGPRLGPASAWRTAVITDGGGGVAVAWHSSVALARTTFIKNSLDQLSQLMWVKVAAGPTVTLLQFQDFGVKILIFRVDDQIIHFGFSALTICH
jgi:hypothetical protein